MNVIRISLCLLGLATLSATSLQAQIPGGGNPGEVNAAIMRLFGDQKAFQATADLKVSDKNQRALVNTPVEVAVLDGKARFAFDLTKVSGASLPPESISMIKAAGMAQVVSVARPDLKQVLILYPEQKSMLRMPMEEKDAKAAQDDTKLAKTVLGKETIDGHPCVKNKVALTDAQGGSTEATIWNATDMKDFPIQIEATDKGMTTLLKFAKVSFTKPSSALFEVPTGYREYKNMMEAVQAMMGLGASTPK